MARPSRFASRGRRDQNHKAIQDVFIMSGWPLVDLSMVGGGCPDLLVMDRLGDIFLVEVKTPRGVVSAKQREFARIWGVRTIRTCDEAHAFIAAQDQQLREVIR